MESLCTHPSPGSLVLYPDKSRSKHLKKTRSKRPMGRNILIPLHEPKIRTKKSLTSDIQVPDSTTEMRNTLTKIPVDFVRLHLKKVRFIIG